MPIYRYRCPDCGVFEMDGRRDEREAECACGSTATRLPFSGVPYLRGETVSKNIPDPAYRFDAQAKEHRATGWDLDRAVRTLRTGIREDSEGRRYVDLKGIKP